MPGLHLPGRTVRAGPQPPNPGAITAARSGSSERPLGLLSRDEPEPMLGNWDFIKVNKEEILHDYRQKPGAFIPEFVALDDLAEIYLNNPGFHSSFEDFVHEWQEEDNAVECEF